MSTQKATVITIISIVGIIVLVIIAWLVGRELIAPTEPTTTTPAPDQSQQQSPAEQSQTTITRDKAGQIATGKYGGTVKSIEPDTHNGQPTWEVEITGSQQGRIEVDVDQASGDIVKVEQD